MIKKIFFASIFIVIIIGIILPGLVRALPYWDVSDTIVDSALNGANSIKKQGNYLYVSAHIADSLVVIDATNPANLSIVGSVSDPVNLDSAWDIGVSGNYAYVIERGGSMTVVDISNPAVPVVSNSLLISPHSAESIEIVGNNAYVFAVDSLDRDLYKIDISNPLIPTIVNATTISTTGITGNVYVIQGPPGYLYLVDSFSDTLKIVDINGVQPVVVGSVSIPHGLSIASYNNEYVYIVDGINPMVIVDVRQITNPVLIGTIAVNPYSVAVYNDYLYTTVPTGLNVYDVSSPTNPILIDSVVATFLNGREMLADGTIVFSSNTNNTVQTVASFDLVGLPPPTVQLDVEFQSATYSDLEANGGNKPALTVSGGITTSAQTVDLIQTATTGTSGVDFTFTTPTTITIPANDYTLPVSIPLSTFLTINNDTTVEQPDETISFSLGNPSIDVTIGTQSTTVYTIIDDDAPPLTTVTVEFDAANYSDLESVGGDIPVLTVSGGSLALANSIDVDYVNGTATPSGAGTDFTFGGTVTIPIPAGSYTVPVLIPMTGLAIINDSAVEPNETINFVLQTPSADVTVGTQNTTTYTIINNDTSGSSGGGGGGGGGYIRIPTDDDTPTDPVTPPSDDAPAATQCPYFTEYMKLGDKDVYRGGQKNEVGRLQDFLTKQNFASTMPIDGVFGQVTHYAVAAWQKHYESEILWPWSLFSNEAGTGWFYQSSRRWANMQKGCVEGTILDNGAFLDIDPNRLRVFR